MSNLCTELICLFNIKYCLKPTALSPMVLCKTALEGIKKMEEFNYTSSLGKETLCSKAAGLSGKYENIS